MKKIISFALIAIISLVALAGCSQNSSENPLEPIIGTWSVTTLGIPTTLVFNSDGTTNSTTTVLGISSTTSGTWTSTDTTITRTWADGSTDLKYYKFASDNDQMTLSDDPDGLAITYTRS
jgi:uncharacterized lipoprotein NlpE involved in copper resistance